MQHTLELLKKEIEKIVFILEDLEKTKSYKINSKELSALENAIYNSLI